MLVETRLELIHRGAIYYLRRKSIPGATDAVVIATLVALALSKPFNLKIIEDESPFDTGIFKSPQLFYNARSYIVPNDASNERNFIPDDDKDDKDDDDDVKDRTDNDKNTTNEDDDNENSKDIDFDYDDTKDEDKEEATDNLYDEIYDVLDDLIDIDQLNDDVEEGDDETSSEKVNIVLSEPSEPTNEGNDFHSILNLLENKSQSKKSSDGSKSSRKLIITLDTNSNEKSDGKDTNTSSEKLDRKEDDISSEKLDRKEDDTSSEKLDRKEDDTSSEKIDRKEDDTSSDEVKAMVSSAQSEARKVETKNKSKKDNIRNDKSTEIDDDDSPSKDTSDELIDISNKKSSIKSSQEERDRVSKEVDTLDSVEQNDEKSDDTKFKAKSFSEVLESLRQSRQKSKSTSETSSASSSFNKQRKLVDDNSDSKESIVSVREDTTSSSSKPKGDNIFSMLGIDSKEDVNSGEKKSKDTKSSTKDSLKEDSPIASKRDDNDDSKEDLKSFTQKSTSTLRELNEDDSQEEEAAKKSEILIDSVVKASIVKSKSKSDLKDDSTEEFDSSKENNRINSALSSSKQSSKTESSSSKKTRKNSSVREDDSSEDMKDTTASISHVLLGKSVVEVKVSKEDSKEDLSKSKKSKSDDEPDDISIELKIAPQISNEPRKIVADVSLEDNRDLVSIITNGNLRQTNFELRLKKDSKEDIIDSSKESSSSSNASKKTKTIEKPKSKSENVVDISEEDDDLVTIDTSNIGSTKQTSGQSAAVKSKRTKITDSSKSISHSQEDSTETDKPDEKIYEKDSSKENTHITEIKDTKKTIDSSRADDDSGENTNSIEEAKNSSPKSQDTDSSKEDDERFISDGQTKSEISTGSDSSENDRNPNNWEPSQKILIDSAEDITGLRIHQLDLKIKDAPRDEDSNEKDENKKIKDSSDELKTPIKKLKVHSSPRQTTLVVADKRAKSSTESREDSKLVGTTKTGKQIKSSRESSEANSQERDNLSKTNHTKERKQNQRHSKGDDTQSSEIENPVIKISLASRKTGLKTVGQINPKSDSQETVSSEKVKDISSEDVKSNRRPVFPLNRRDKQPIGSKTSKSRLQASQSSKTSAKSKKVVSQSKELADSRESVSTEKTENKSSEDKTSSRRLVVPQHKRGKLPQKSRTTLKSSSQTNQQSKSILGSRIAAKEVTGQSKESVDSKETISSENVENSSSEDIKSTRRLIVPQHMRARLPQTSKTFLKSNVGSKTVSTSSKFAKEVSSRTDSDSRERISTDKNENTQSQGKTFTRRPIVPLLRRGKQSKDSNISLKSSVLVNLAKTTTIQSKSAESKETISSEKLENISSEDLKSSRRPAVPQNRKGIGQPHGARKSSKSSLQINQSRKSNLAKQSTDSKEEISSETSKDASSEDVSSLRLVISQPKRKNEQTQSSKAAPSSRNTQKVSSRTKISKESRETVSAEEPKSSSDEVSTPKRPVVPQIRIKDPLKDNSRRKDDKKVGSDSIASKPSTINNFSNLQIPSSHLSNASSDEIAKFWKSTLAKASKKNKQQAGKGISTFLSTEDSKDISDEIAHSFGFGLEKIEPDTLSTSKKTGIKRVFHQLDDSVEEKIVNLSLLEFMAGKGKKKESISEPNKSKSSSKDDFTSFSITTHKSDESNDVDSITILNQGETLTIQESSKEDLSSTFSDENDFLPFGLEAIQDPEVQRGISVTLLSSEELTDQNLSKGQKKAARTSKDHKQNQGGKSIFTSGQVSRDISKEKSKETLSLEDVVLIDNRGKQFDIRESIEKQSAEDISLEVVLSLTNPNTQKIFVEKASNKDSFFIEDALVLNKQSKKTKAAADSRSKESISLEVATIDLQNKRVKIVDESKSKETFSLEDIVLIDRQNPTATVHIDRQSKEDISFEDTLLFDRKDKQKVAKHDRQSKESFSLEDVILIDEQNREIRIKTDNDGKESQSLEDIILVDKKNKQVTIKTDRPSKESQSLEDSILVDKKNKQVTIKIDGPSKESQSLEDVILVDKKNKQATVVVDRQSTESISLEDILLTNNKNKVTIKDTSKSKEDISLEDIIIDKQNKRIGILNDRKEMEIFSFKDVIVIDSQSKKAKVDSKSQETLSLEDIVLIEKQQKEIVAVDDVIIPELKVVVKDSEDISLLSSVSKESTKDILTIEDIGKAFGSGSRKNLLKEGIKTPGKKLVIEIDSVEVDSHQILPQSTTKQQKDKVVTDKITKPSATTILKELNKADNEEFLNVFKSDTKESSILDDSHTFDEGDILPFGIFPVAPTIPEAKESKDFKPSFDVTFETIEDSTDEVKEITIFSKRPSASEGVKKEKDISVTKESDDSHTFDGGDILPFGIFPVPPTIPKGKKSKDFKPSFDVTFETIEDSTDEVKEIIISSKRPTTNKEAKKEKDISVNEKSDDSHTFGGGDILPFGIFPVAPTTNKGKKSKTSFDATFETIEDSTDEVTEIIVSGKGPTTSKATKKVKDIILVSEKSDEDISADVSDIRGDGFKSIISLNKNIFPVVTQIETSGRKDSSDKQSEKIQKELKTSKKDHKTHSVSIDDDIDTRDRSSVEKVVSMMEKIKQLSSLDISVEDQVPSSETVEILLHNQQRKPDTLSKVSISREKSSVESSLEQEGKSKEDTKERPAIVISSFSKKQKEKPLSPAGTFFQVGKGTTEISSSEEVKLGKIKGTVHVSKPKKAEEKPAVSRHPKPISDTKKHDTAVDISKDDKTSSGPFRKPVLVVSESSEETKASLERPETKPKVSKQPSKISSESSKKSKSISDIMKNFFRVPQHSYIKRTKKESSEEELSVEVIKQKPKPTIFTIGKTVSIPKSRKPSVSKDKSDEGSDEHDSRVFKFSKPAQTTKSKVKPHQYGYPVSSGSSFSSLFDSKHDDSTEGRGHSQRKKESSEIQQKRYGQSHGTSYRTAKIVKDDRRQDAKTGQYYFNFETSDGIKRQESGTRLKEDGSISKQGEYSFVFPTGENFHLSFVADKNGFQPESEWLPVAPKNPHPIPGYVLRQIEKAKREDEQKGLKTHNYGVSEEESSENSHGYS